MRTTSTFFLTMAAALAMPVLAVADDLASVERDIVTKMTAYKTMSGKVEMAMAMARGMASKGTVEYMIKDDRELYRMDLTMDMSFGGQSVKTSQLIVCDGEVVYIMMDRMGQKMVTKQKPGAEFARPGGAKMFEQLKENGTLKLLPDERIGEEAVYVIESEPHSADRTKPVKTRWMFSKKTGMMLKMIGMDAGGNAMMTMTYSDIEVNPKLDPKRFDFEVPDGVPVMDQTGF